jgi:4'-phosphopantetheinyl transferase
VAVAVTDVGPVGVDIERISDLTGIESYVLHHDELRPDKWPDVLRYWVRKEAVLKATGVGLSVSMNSVKVSAPTAAPAVLELPCRDLSLSEISMHDVDVGSGYLASVAVLNPHSDIAVRDGSELVAATMS